MNKKRYRIAFTLGLILLVVLSAGDSRSQSVDRDRILNALNRTDLLIDKAGSVVRESRSRKARLTLENAITLQERARIRARSDNYSNTRQNSLAYRLTLSAREEAKKAVSFARTETRMLEKHHRVTERTRDRLMSLRSRMSEAGIRDMTIRKMIEDAGALLEKSRTNATQSNNRMALKLALNAEQLADKAEERIRKANNLKKMCQRRLQLMERLVTRARNRVRESSAPMEREQLDRAETQLERAKAMFGEGKYQACRTSIVKSEKSMRSLMSRLGPEGETAVQARIRQTWRLYDRVEESAEEAGMRDERIETAERLINSAQEEAERDDERKALQLLSRAGNMLKQVQDQSTPAVSRERVESRIRNLEMEMRGIREVVRNCDSPESETLYRRAVGHLEKARDRLQRGEIESAYSETRLAENIFDRITEICSI